VKTFFHFWKKVSSPVRFHLFIVFVTRMATSMVTDGLKGFILPPASDVDLPRRMALLFSWSEYGGRSFLQTEVYR
jgi:hypothetical protein